MVVLLQVCSVALIFFGIRQPTNWCLIDKLRKKQELIWTSQNIKILRLLRIASNFVLHTHTISLSTAKNQHLKRPNYHKETKLPNHFSVIFQFSTRPSKKRKLKEFQERLNCLVGKQAILSTLKRITRLKELQVWTSKMMNTYKHLI